MCWRRVTKLKALCVVLLYILVYILISLAVAPDVAVTFVSDEYRIGDKYVLMYLVAPGAPAFSDADGEEPFRIRHCGSCFVTNNKGFLPMSVYDAVLVVGDRTQLTEAVMDPGKLYMVEVSRKCIRTKMTACYVEPIITSFGSKEEYTLCSLCRSLQPKQLK